MPATIFRAFGFLLALPVLWAGPPDVTVAGQSVPASRIDEIFAEWNRTDSPGCAVGIVSAGELVFSKGYGMANLEHGVPIKPDTVFYAGSVSKQFVAFAIALLEESGKISLDQDIRKYFPEMPDYGTPITIRHMIHHTSGLRDYLGLWNIKGRDTMDHMPPDQVLDLIQSQEQLNFGPGEKYLYSNSGYYLLAEIVYRASGSSLREFSRDQIFEPLGMDSSHFHDDHLHIISRKAQGYRRSEGGWEFLNQRFALVGSGGLYTTVEDLARWDANFYGNRLGRKEQSLIERTLETGKLNDGKDLDYAFAQVVGKYRGLPTVRHSGALGGYRAHLLRFPQQRLTAALLCNLANINPGEQAEQISELFLVPLMENTAESVPQKSTPKERPSVGVEPEVLADYAGAFGNEQGLIIEFELRNDGLFLHWPGIDPLQLKAESETTFFQDYDDDRFRFVRSDGGVDQVIVLGGDRELSFQRSPQLSESELNAFSGRYYSPELDAHYRLEVKDGSLRVRAGFSDWRKLRPLEAARFSDGSGMVLEFEFEGERKVGGFRLQTGQFKNLRFERE